MKTKLHPGCGHIINEGWLHLDPAQLRGGMWMDDSFQRPRSQTEFGNEEKANKLGFNGAMLRMDGSLGPTDRPGKNRFRNYCFQSPSNRRVSQ